ncbi:MAG: hypothetical protein ACTHQQ_17910, partial [Solirubrobacteraceae bacterium]
HARRRQATPEVGELARIDDQAQTLTTPSAISNTNNVDQRALAFEVERAGLSVDSGELQAGAQAATLTRAGGTPLGAR